MYYKIDLNNYEPREVPAYQEFTNYNDISSEQIQVISEELSEFKDSFGKDKIIWGTWGEHKAAESDVPRDLVDVEFDCVDYTNTNHPGPESNKLYAEKLKKIIDERYEANKISKTM